MPWVVDTCVLIDVLEDDPKFGAASAARLESLAGQGLVICPVTYAELAPAFAGQAELQDEFLSGVGADWTEPWTWQDTRAAHAAWAQFIEHRRRKRTPKRPLADVLIGAFASRHNGLITRNGKDFATLFPELHVEDPTR